jgi:hypothetical protein
MDIAKLRDSFQEQFSTHFDDKLAGIPHYQKHPQMMPFIGSHYGSHGSRILIIGESHYLRKSSTVHLNAEDWYTTNASELLPHDCSHTNTRACLTKSSKNWRSKSYTIFRNLENPLIEAGYPDVDNSLRFIAFMNGFQRPAVSRLSIHSTPVDKQHSTATVQSVIDIIEPEHIIFVSRKAYSELGKHLNQPSHAVPHPASAWWNRNSRRGTGKAQMQELLNKISR